MPIHRHEAFKYAKRPDAVQGKLKGISEEGNSPSSPSDHTFASSDQGYSSPSPSSALSLPSSRFSYAHMEHLSLDPLEDSSPSLSNSNTFASSDLAYLAPSLSSALSLPSSRLSYAQMESLSLNPLTRSKNSKKILRFLKRFIFSSEGGNRSPVEQEMAIDFTYFLEEKLENHEPFKRLLSAYDDGYLRTETGRWQHATLDHLGSQLPYHPLLRAPSKPVVLPEDREMLLSAFKDYLLITTTHQFFSHHRDDLFQEYKLEYFSDDLLEQVATKVSNMKKKPSASNSPQGPISYHRSAPSVPLPIKLPKGK